MPTANDLAMEKAALNRLTIDETQAGIKAARAFRDKDLAEIAMKASPPKPGSLAPAPARRATKRRESLRRDSMSGGDTVYGDVQARGGVDAGASTRAEGRPSSTRAEGRPPSTRVEGQPLPFEPQRCPPRSRK